MAVCVGCHEFPGGELDEITPIRDARGKIPGFGLLLSRQLGFGDQQEKACAAILSQRRLLEQAHAGLR